MINNVNIGFEFYKPQSFNQLQTNFNSIVNSEIELTKIFIELTIPKKLIVQNENEIYQNRMRKTLDNDELTLLREGLKKKLDTLEKQYGRISHRNKFDTLVARNYKENLEKEMEQVRKDLDCINKDIFTVDMTK